jgi:hypothetical protein
MAAELAQQLPDRSVVGDRVVFRLHAPEVVASVRSGAEHAAQVEVRLNALLLNVVEALVIGLPDIDLGVIDRLAVGIEDASA